MGLFKRRVEKRKEKVFKTVMPERHYDMLEVVVEHWNRNIRGINKQSLGERLRGKEVMEYPDVQEDVDKDIQYLHERGYVFCQADIVFPTHRGTTVYRMVHPNVLISANCELRE